MSTLLLETRPHQTRPNRSQDYLTEVYLTDALSCTETYEPEILQALMDQSEGNQDTELSTEQEVELEENTQDWVGRTSNMARLSQEQEIALAHRMQNPRSPRDAQAAKDALVMANMRLVASVARRYLGYGLPLEDLMQEGAIGLIRAAERFDPARGYRFGTFAIWAIRRTISRALANQARVIRLPVHITETLGRLNKTRGRLYETLGRMPTHAELAAALDLTEEKLSALQRQTVHALSLETPLGEENENCLADQVCDADASNPIEEARKSTMRAALLQALEQLTAREKAVVRLRYGLDGNAPRTHEEVARTLEVSRERVRQLEEAALRKLRKPACSRPLQELLH